MAKTRVARKGPAPSSLVHKTQFRQKQRSKRVSWRDEQGGLSLIGTPPPIHADPAILAVNPKFRYGKEELLKLREVPLSQRKPDFLDVNEVSPTIWDPTRWNTDRKKAEAPPLDNGKEAEHRRRPGDPRERLRKENDGIVLSPQRRSFNSGCFVPVREPAAPRSSNRPHSPLGGKSDLGGGGAGGGAREPGTRRIGSGRILRDAWDFNDKGDAGDNDYGFRPQQRNNGQLGGGDGGQERERRSFGREYEKDKDRDRRSGGRYGDRRRIGERDEEPEWFSSGPISQNDTIELRGFEESDRLVKKKMSPSQAKRARDWSRKKSEVPTTIAEDAKDDVCVEGAPGGRSTPTPQASDADAVKRPDKNGDGDGPKSHENKNDQSFNFEDILKSDTIPGLPGLLANGVGGDGDAQTKSRFSKWFSVDNAVESRGGPLHDDAIITNILKNIHEPSVAIPGDSESYFAPISPAANNSNNSKSITIMEMLQRSKQAEPSHKSQVPGRIMNLVELEAKMRQQNNEPPMHNKHAQKSDEEMTAFNRLLAHMSNNAQNGGMSQKAPMSLMEMLSHSQQQDEARMAQMLSPSSPNAPGIDVLSKLMNAGVPRASPLPEMGLQQSRELLSRPEAQAILQAIHQRIPSPRELQVHTQNILQRALIKKKLEEQQENYRKKQEMQQRGQSPINNNNNIPAPKSVSSPTPLAFTPTSVLRKMTAEKDEKDGKGRAVTGMRPAQAVGVAQWGAYPPQSIGVKQAGRPIVKANSFQPVAQQQEQYFTQQQQQKFLNQLHAQQQRKQFQGFPQQQQQQQMSAGGYSNANQQFAQLRAQHQARPPVAANQPAAQPGYQQPQGGANWLLNTQQQQQRGRGGFNDGDLSPTTNQLTRWFTPDLLERARVGELPTTAGLSQPVLSLEEIERITAPTVHN